MSKKAIYALILAIGIPLACYFIIKVYRDKNVVMPKRYFADSVRTVTEDGTQRTDTVWHKLPDYTFTNQLGKKVSLYDLDSQILVINFFFTRCPTICPSLTENMKKLQDGIHKPGRVGDLTADFIHFISLSVDPERDSVEALKKWADRFQVDPENWWLLTGSKKEIYDLSINDLKLAAVDGQNVDTSFIHTDRFVLVDRNKIIRGYYHGLDTNSLASLTRDVIYLALEKDKTKKGFLAGKLELIAVVLLIAMIATGILLFVFKKQVRSDAATSMEKK